MMVKLWTKLHRGLVTEILRLHVVTIFVVACFGYVGFDLIQPLLERNGSHAGVVNITAQSGDFSHILGNNLFFFTLVSLMPVINSLLIIPQFLMFGVHARAVANLPAESQFIILYRHSILEVCALLLSISISYYLLFGCREYMLEDSDSRGKLRAQLLALLRVYGVVVVITLLGAMLEGSVGVRI